MTNISKTTCFQKYLTPKSKANTFVVLGSSASKPDIESYVKLCSNVVQKLVLSGKNILSGCGGDGIMGACYNSAKTFSKLNCDGKPEQNLVVTVKPLWGDEDLQNCIVLFEAESEAQRIDEFIKFSNNFIIFAGSAGTLQEACALISHKYYCDKNDEQKIILVGRKFFKGLNEQYKELYNYKLMKKSPEELYKIVENEDEILRALGIL